MKVFCPALRVVTVFLSLLLTGAFHAFAAGTDVWTNAASGLWRTTANWSSNQAPDSTFSSILITNAGSKTVTVDSGTLATNLSIQRLTVSGPTGTANTLALVDLTTNTSLQISNSLTIDRGALLYMTNSALKPTGIIIDHGGSLNVTNSVIQASGPSSILDVVNGSVWLESGLVDLTAIQALRIGRTNNAAGSVTVNGGSMLASLLEIGTTTAARGTLTLSGGSVSASSIVTVGYGVNSTGNVAITSGALIATNDVTYVGKSGFGQMTINGGNATFAFISVGNNADGELDLKSGLMTMNPRTTNDWLQIGAIGAGTFNMTGGTLLAGGEFHVGDDSSGLATGSGVATITGGLIIATNDTTAIGRYGPGQMIVSNATVVLTNVSVGRHDGATGTLDIQNNAQVFMLDALSIGRFSNSVGHVLVEGGLLSLTNDVLWVGREGSGDMTLSNGTVRATAALVAVSTVVTDSITQFAVTNTPTGSLTIAGGSLVLTSNMLVGTSLLSTGHVMMASGSLSIIGSGNPGYLSVSSGDFTLNQGSVACDNLYLTNSNGQFVFNGGTLKAKSVLVSNGLPFVVGDGVHLANLQLLGGTFAFGSGLLISSNAAVSGCGTIVGTISNFGTLATNCPSPGVTITSATKAGATATVFFTTLNGSNHVLEYKNSLTDAVWSAILPGVIGNGSPTNKADTNATGASRFYRIHVQ